MQTSKTDFATSVSRECMMAAAQLERLQGKMSEALDPLALSDETVADLQALDGVHQTLIDLGAIFQLLSETSRLGEDFPHLSPELAQVITQESLKQRLLGAGPPAERGTVDLF